MLANSRADKETDKRHGADGQMSRCAHEEVDDEWEESGVQTVGRWHLAQFSVAHTLGDVNGTNTDARDNITDNPLFPLVVTHYLDAGQNFSCNSFQSCVD